MTRSRKKYNIAKSRATGAAIRAKSRATGAAIRAKSRATGAAIRAKSRATGAATSRQFSRLGQRLAPSEKTKERVRETARKTKQYLKNFLPSWTLILVLFIVFGFLHLFGAVDAFDQCECLGDGKKGSCVKFSKPNKTVCKETRCRLFGAAMIMFGLLFLIVKNPNVMEKVRRGGKGGKIALGVFVIVMCGTVIGFMVYDTFFAKDKKVENYDDNDELVKEKKEPSILKIIIIFLIAWVLFRGLIGLIFCSKTEKQDSKGMTYSEKDHWSCFLDGAFAPFDFSRW